VTDEHTPAAAGPGDRLVQVGVALFGLGFAAIAVVFVLFLLYDDGVPAALAIACLLAPLGVGLALGGLLRQARAPGRAERDDT
jgi:hypothetical protein